MFEIHTRLEMPRSSGIYKLTNRINGKVYIGKSVDMHQRFIDYNNDIRKGKKRFVLDAIRKYGWESFKLEIIEIYPNRANNDYLLDREAFWIKFYMATKKGIGYNLCEYSRDRGGIPLTEEHKRRIGDANRAKKLTVSKENRSKMIDGLREKAKTREFKLNIVNKRPYKIIVHQIDPSTMTVIKTWDLISDIAEYFSMTYEGISYFLKTGKIHKGFIWKSEKVTNC